jgi:hypothetical protein
MDATELSTLLRELPWSSKFELTREELENLRCQIGISSWGGIRYLPFVLRNRALQCFPVSRMNLAGE